MSLEALKTRLHEIHTLRQVGAIVSWDQQCYMPPGAAEARAEHLATISKITHEMFVADETGKLLEAAEKEVTGMDYDSYDASLVRVTRRDYDQNTKIPTALVAEIERTTSLAHQIWAEARAGKEFSKFLPMLEKIFDLVGQQAEHLGYKDDIYDALIDLYEPGMTTAEVKRVFTELRRDLVPVVQAIAANKDAANEDVIRQNFPIDKQREFGEMVVKKFGYDFSRGRQDLAVHPFCTHFSRDDVRITTRFDENWLSPALFGTLHEAGHAMYEQGIAPELDDNILSGGTSLGVHESQSRMWENIVGRSRGFWQYFYKDLQATFPGQLGNVDLDTFYRAINTSQPSFIRVEADEVTYPMHIMLRFDVEVQVLNGELEVKDLPQAWNAMMEEYLGIVPEHDSLGVLQDVHWSMGIMGYFPTYCLGTLLSVQYYNKAVETHPSIPDEICDGKFDTLLGWLRENIHQHGRKYEPQELTKRVTGTGIQTAPYVQYIKSKFGEIYGF